MQHANGFTRVVMNRTKCFNITLAFLCSFLCLGTFIVFIVFLGKYAFANPDREAYYGVVQRGKPTLFTSEAEALEMDAFQVTNVHGRMITWFLWGFIQSLIPCATLILSSLCSYVAQWLAISVVALGTATIGCGGLVWWITGIVWRFSEVGKFSSGDYIQAGYTEEEWDKFVTSDATENLFQF